MKRQTEIYIALPVLNEYARLPALIECLKRQSCKGFKLIVCVNQFDGWWDEPDKLPICNDNQKSIDYLASQEGISISVIDKSSRGKGWPLKRGGVGWARKTAMDFANREASEGDLIVSIDADTFYPPDYLQSIADTFSLNPDYTGLSVPYYHPLHGNETAALILRYEIYMRNYLLNMIRIENPYAFTALGSAMALPVWAYRKIGGITPVKSGEDFYFLQKLAKTGALGLWTEAIAYPSPRFSERVFFGTGPALIKGSRGDWDSYPVYPAGMFNLVKQTFETFGDLFVRDVPTPMDDFFKSQFKTTDIWGALRKNFKNEAAFIKACKTKIDGLRVLQFLKQRQKSSFDESDYEHVVFKQNALPVLNTVQFVKDYSALAVAELTQLREAMFKVEMKQRRKIRSTGLK